MFYVGSPYSDPDPRIVQIRYESALQFTASLIVNYGIVAYSPIVHNHEIAQRFSIKGDWSTWAKHDLKMLSLAEVFIIYQLQGWDRSKGLKEEIQFANSCEIPTLYCNSPANAVIELQKLEII